MNYKTELHCHSETVSLCAHLPVEEMVEDYINSGYSTIVVTDHFSNVTFADKAHLSWSEKCEFFVSGYKKVKEASAGRINVILGMEYRSIYDKNDYLIYGLTEKFLKNYNISDDDNLTLLKLEDMASLVHENGMLIYQAHPFRNSMKLIKPGIVDGIEVMNCSPRHDSRNDIAMQWAEKFSLNICGGSDCHRKMDTARGGIITDFEIKTNDELIKALKADIQLIVPED